MVPLANSLLLSCCGVHRDAASAVVVGAQQRPGEEPIAKILRTGSSFISNTLEYVHIKDGDEATISWYNSKDLPNAVSKGVPDLVNRLVRAVPGADIKQTAFAMHPGGPKVLQLTADALGLPDSAFAVSWDFLAEHGNTSGSSNLALLHNELMRAGTDESPITKNIICIGIGPGLALEGLLLQRTGKEERQGLQLLKPVAWMGQLLGRGQPAQRVQSMFARAPSSLGHQQSWIAARGFEFEQ